MTIFKKRITLNENIAYMGIMAAINVLFVLLTTLVPVLLFTIVFVLPLTSAIVTIYCNKKYFPIYALSTILLCMIVTIWNIGDTIFYVIPSIISGFLFAILLEKKVHPLLIVLTATSIQVLISYLSVPLIKLITGISIIDTFINAFSLDTFTYNSYLIPAFVLLISLVQSIISYAVIKDEINKFVIIEEKTSDHLVTSITNLITLCIMVIISLFAPEYSLAILCLSIIISTYQLVRLLMSKNYIVYILLGVSLLISFFGFALFYAKLPNPLGILLIGLYSLLVTIITLVNNYLLKENSKYRINV